MVTKSVLRLLTELSSRKWISKTAGFISKSKMSRTWIPRFAKIYRIPLHEAEKAVSEYESLNDFFTRRLKPGSRPLDGDEQALISPVDGTVASLGAIEDGQILSVKGQPYTIKELLNDSPRAVNYVNGFFYVIYLSPSDYHRIHAPVSGEIVEKDHIPGRVYPVNAFGMTHMRKVLSRNERLITYIRHAAGEVAMIKVGAMNVSSIRYAEPLSEKIGRGDELAYFEFGSTVVLLMENDTFLANGRLKVGDKVRFGQALGTVSAES